MCEWVSSLQLLCYGFDKAGCVGDVLFGMRPSSLSLVVFIFHFFSLSKKF
eukprot:m.116754 g.116754  ORF g.116754 m.116754 type:complete len:50 (+) comp12861_c3_seq5:479-628(+)